MEWTIEGAIAAYAAIVGTGALFLEIRRWRESGARLSLSLMADAQIVGDGRIEEKGLIVANVTNRGDMPTTITNLGILRFENFFQRLRDRPAESYIILHPQLEGHPPVIPSEVGPGRLWMGIARPRPDVIPNLRNGEYYIAVYGSHRRQPTVARIPAEEPNALSDAVPLDDSKVSSATR